MISKVTITGDKELEEGLRKLDQNLSRVAQPLKTSAEFMRQEANRNFPAQGKIFEETWPPYKPPEWRVSKTGRRYFFPGSAEIKKRAGFGGKPLMVRTGLLKGSFLIMGPRTAHDTGTVEVYNPVPYAISHQLGIPRGVLPRRVLLKLAKKQVDEIVNIFVGWVSKQIRQSFKK